MTITAKDLMIIPYRTLQQSQYLPEAFQLFKEASSVEGELQGMIVTNDDGHLVGVLSMYDIFLLFVPKHIHVWGTMEDIHCLDLLDRAYEKARNVKVEDVMTSDPIVITSETPLMSILDLIIKKHIRKIPVIDGKSFVGLIYAADVFYYLVNQVSDEPTLKCT